MSKHSPLPWKWIPQEKNSETLDRVVDANGDEVLNFGISEAYYPTAGEGPTQDDSDFIIKAVNNHDKLVEMLRGVLKDAEYYRCMAYSYVDPSQSVKDAEKFLAEATE